MALTTFSARLMQGLQLKEGCAEQEVAKKMVRALALRRFVMVVSIVETFASQQVVNHKDERG